MEQFNAVFNQILLFFSILVIGFCIVKFKILGADYLPVISRLFTRVILPFILFTYTSGGATRAELVSYSYLLIVNVCIFAALLISTRVLPKLLRLKGNRVSLFILVNSFGNVGFIGMPLLLAIYGQRAMIFVVLYTIIDQILFWTYGIYQTYPYDNKPKFSLKMLKNMVNPPIMAIGLSFVVILLGIQIPQPILRACEAMASTGSALPFLYIGGVVATLDVKKLFRFYEIYVGMVFKMIALPICIFLILRAIGIAPEIIGTTVILYGLPAIGIVPMLVSNNGSDEEYATVAVITTTLASIIAIPLVAYITTMVL
ncbi:MAG: AEC family transporter [Oscillospiraceae bacterium]|nr:AEC family transporter [Oscillospiraceae bacterium]